VHFELIDAETHAVRPLVDDSEGELVLTISSPAQRAALAIERRHYPFGRPVRRVRCIGPMDDMLIARSVNVSPSLVREVINNSRPPSPA
jgi:phenylacetate-CoA ligase